MPELPEVEIVNRSLLKLVNKNKITKIKVFNRNLRYKLPKQFSKILLNSQIYKIKRRSKYIIFYFKNNLCLIMHLGMSGIVFIKDIKNDKNFKTSFYNQSKIITKHNHILFYLSNKKVLVYNDPRRFGFFKILKKKEINSEKFLIKLGPEPLSDNFNYIYFLKFIKNKNKNIKNLLMDQTFVSGLGNIYVNESLFDSSLNPFKKISTLKVIQIKKLIKSIKVILKKSIKLGGSSIKNFKNTTGIDGLFQQKFKVYNKNGSVCPNLKCKEIIRKKIISQRSTFYCPVCQK